MKVKPRKVGNWAGYSQATSEQSRKPMTPKQNEQMRKREARRRGL